jgi:serine protease SohB
VEFWTDYGAFLLKTLTLLGAFLLVLGAIVSSGIKTKGGQEGELKITKLNDVLQDFKDRMAFATLDKDTFKAQQKAKTKAEKAAKKAAKKAGSEPEAATAIESSKTAGEPSTKTRDEPLDATIAAGDLVAEKVLVESPAQKNLATDQLTPIAAEDKSVEDKSNGQTSTEATKARVFVLTFEGDKKASAVEHLSHEITAVLGSASQQDEIVVRLESPGGMVHTYGLAASQLQRIRDKGLKLTICVDKVAASGGYMMAVVGHQILAAPFAIIGSIGVVAQLPNVHRLLKKNNVDIELFTAGEYKRTVTMLGENTTKGRQKFQQDLEETHQLFKSFVKDMRPQLDIDQVADGDIWYGSQAIKHQLIDRIQTSDQYLMERCEQAEVYEVEYERKKSLAEKLGMAAEGSFDRVLTKWLSRSNANTLIS